MIDSQIAEKVNQAKDQFGVITLEAAQKQLGSFTAADWQEASKLFAPDPAKPDGFFIEDKAGNGNIHNDISQAITIANSNALALTAEDVGTIGNYAAGALFAGVAAAGGGAMAYEASATGVGLLSEVALDAGIGAALSTVLVGSVAAIVGSGLVLAGDVVRNAIRQNAAVNDAANNAVVNVQAAESTAG
jgi:hypothetical protein